ncbi:MAG: 50S ribosomal protein L22 [Elusimicrobia bacterium RIFOXYA2_FULL_50_26]|nr:MAG: 50S ribosomal protein L22 [Elusimicrobia bacterium RIFOXYA2_FULL_50_26]OGS25212.1 MAG: 50S ribosomal protein L22 [Elusimicrobia bacterium RIFOXYB2_FULL_50_12]
MEATAQSKFARYAPRKVNQVLQLIRNKPAAKAMEILAFTNKVSAILVGKTLKSAIANAGRLKNMDGLKVKSCWIGNGPVLKRMRPGPMGRGMPYKRKMCHLTVVVADMEPGELKIKKKKSAKSIVKEQGSAAAAPANPQ